MDVMEERGGGEWIIRDGFHQNFGGLLLLHREATLKRGAKGGKRIGWRTEFDPGAMSPLIGPSPKGAT
jgi:hypothetical protein